MKAAIIGAGKSGLAAKEILFAKGYNDIRLYDDNVAGASKIKDYKDIYNITVISPGIAMNILPVKPTNYTSEIELAYEMVHEGCSIIGITGTNGKSTVTHLTAQIIKKAGLHAVACGNIGTPFATAVKLALPKTVFVVELSSFQIELLHKFHMKACAFINLTPDHLDRYANVNEYYDAKLGILRFFDNDTLLVAGDDSRIVNAALKSKAKVKYVNEKLDSYPKLKGNILDFGNYSVDINSFKLFGWHNLVNLSFALSVADTVCHFKGDITDIVKGLSGMPHRAETVGIYKGIRFINDSKATNVDSTLTALKSCQKPTVLLLGGKDKNSDYTQLLDELNRCCTKVIAFGAAAGIIEKQIKHLYKGEFVVFGRLKDAVKHSFEEKTGTTVLLSPACSSFDEFNNFEHRGEEFANYVQDYGSLYNGADK